MDLKLGNSAELFVSSLPVDTTTSITPIQRSILSSLAYYDIFSYPLTKEELKQSVHSSKVEAGEFCEALNALVSDSLIYQISDYYLLKPDKQKVQRRLQGNIGAQEKLPVAYRMSRLIASFPFVRGVMLSGSISKNYMDEQSDIDYFIVTKPGRLWVVRAMLTAYKKLFLFNSRKHFCINYYVSSDKLEIEERNIFTATELVTLMPAYGNGVFGELHQANSWAREFYPNYQPKPQNGYPTHKEAWHKQLGEWLLAGRFGNWLDELAMRQFVKTWQKKFGHYDKEHFKVAFKSRKDVSKHHPNNFQRKVLEKHHERMQQLVEQHGIELN